LDPNVLLALHASGCEAWNGWSSEMRARRARLEDAGLWRLEVDTRGEQNPANRETADWMRESTADFSYQTFGEPVDFSGFVFAGFATFVAAKFAAPASFRNAIFERAACFNYARFGAAVDFSGAHFISEGAFRDTEFAAAVRFEHARFEAGTASDSLKGLLDMTAARFLGEADFSDVHVEGNALFNDAGFTRPATFDRAKIQGSAFVSRTYVDGDADQKRMALIKAAAGLRPDRTT